MFLILLLSPALKLRKFVRPLFRREFVRNVDASIPMLGSGEKMIHAVRVAAPASLQAPRNVDSVTMLRPIVACLAMLDVKTADLKDDSEGEFDLVLAQGFWPVQP